jgi:3-phytase
VVYDLAGKELHYLRADDVNNVDVRSHVDAKTSFRLGDRAVSLVTVSNRSTNSIGVYTLDPETRLLEGVAARLVVPGITVYGSCMYRSAQTGAFFVFVNSKRGQVEQWELFDDGGRVDAEKVRSFEVGSQTEGRVADDELGHLYLSEERRGIWKYGAEPDDTASRTLVAATDRRGPLVGDVEGLALAYGSDDTGYLIASSQGNSSYVVYDATTTGSGRTSSWSPCRASSPTRGTGPTTAGRGTKSRRASRFT